MISRKMNPDFALILVTATVLGCSIDVLRASPDAVRADVDGTAVPRSSPIAAPRKETPERFQMTPLRHPIWQSRLIAASPCPLGSSTHAMPLDAERGSESQDGHETLFPTV